MTVDLEIADTLMTAFPAAYHAGRDHVRRCKATQSPLPPPQIARETLGRYLEAGERFEATWWLGCCDEIAAVERDEDGAIVSGVTNIAHPFAITDPSPDVLAAWADSLRQWAATTHPARLP